MKRFWLILLACALWLPLSGCNGGDKADAIVSEDETVAVINNSRVSLKAYQTAMRQFMGNYGKIIAGAEQHLPQVRQLVIERLIQEELIRQEAARKGVRVTDQELQAEVSASLEPYPQAGFSRILETQGIAQEQWASRVELLLLTRRLIAQEVSEKVPVTKREISAYYQEHKKELNIKKAMRVKNLALADADAAHSLAQELARGKRMDDLIAEYSISPDRDASGDMGYIEKEDLPMEMENAIFSLNSIGGVSEVVHSQDGYHVFQLVKTRYPKQLTQAEATPMIKNILMRKKEHETYVAWMTKLKERATIKVDENLLRAEEGF